MTRLEVYLNPETKLEEFPQGTTIEIKGKDHNNGDIITILTHSDELTLKRSVYQGLKLRKDEDVYELDLI